METIMEIKTEIMNLKCAIESACFNKDRQTVHQLAGRLKMVAIDPRLITIPKQSNYCGF